MFYCVVHRNKINRYEVIENDLEDFSALNQEEEVRCQKEQFNRKISKQFLKIENSLIIFRS